MLFDWLPFTMSDPAWLIGIAVIPLLYAASRHSLAHLPTARKAWALTVRGLMVLMIVLSLAGSALVHRTDGVFVAFLIDESDSLDPSAESLAADFVDRSTAAADSDQYQLIRFAASPRITASPVQEHVAATDIQAALELAAAMMPPHRVPRIVLLSDGRQTTGDALSTATDLGIPVWSVPLPTRSTTDILVTALNLPTRIAAHEPFSLEAVIHSEHAGGVQIEILRNHQPVIVETRAVTTGENRFVFQQRIHEPSLYTVRVLPQTDRLSDRRSLSGMVLLTDATSVLLVEGRPDPARPLQRALQQEGLQVEAVVVSDLPETLIRLSRHDLILLSNVSATDLTMRQMQAIRAYVSNVGGGLLVVGGDQSFGLGGYYRTQLEDILPVGSDFESEQERPSLGMMLIIDRSGSMGGQKIELARDAARAAVELLSPSDQLGVIAFDGEPIGVIPMGPLTDKSSALNQISAISVGGGTSLYPAMEQGFAELLASDAQLKHMLILTDGYSVPGDFEGITLELAAADMTVSTVGIPDADPELLKLIARAGRGRYYFADDPQSVPQIFARETLTAGTQALREVPFFPTMARAAQALSDLDFQSAPRLLGYVVTRGKPTSEQILATDRGDPLLAWWRYGLGTTAAFTSDDGTRWAAPWLTWEGYSRFWSQVVRHCRRRDTAGNCQITAERLGAEIVVDVRAASPNGRLLNHADTELRVATLNGVENVLSVPQIGPGHYQTRFPAADGEVLQLMVRQVQDGRTIHQQSMAVVPNRSDEFLPGTVNLKLLQELSERTGGLMNASSEEVFQPGNSWARRHTDLTPSLLKAALLLLIADVALRRFPSASAQKSDNGAVASPN